MNPTPHSAWHFSNLNLTHVRLDKLFHRHQNAVKHKQFQVSLRYFNHYEKAVLSHISEEEECLLPFFKEDMKCFVFGGIGVFIEDHHRMRDSFVRIRVLLENWIDNRDSLGAALMIWEEEFSFMQLVRTHESREELYLFPKLDKILGDIERETIREKMTRSWTVIEKKGLRSQAKNLAAG